MASWYYIFTRSTAQYQEDVVHLFSLIKSVTPASTITFDELYAALIRTGLSPRTLYEDYASGYYTREMSRLDTELGLPIKEITGGYWQQRLVEQAKRYGKPTETIDDDLEKALSEGAIPLSKEELARTIVLLNEHASPHVDDAMAAMQRFHSAMAQLMTSGGESAQALDEVKAGMQHLVDGTESPVFPEPVQSKKTNRTPYYQKNKAQWWK